MVRLSRPEMVVGWYHSHPGFGCWLSSVDINTQQVILNHSYDEHKLNPRSSPSNPLIPDLSLSSLTLFNQ